MKTLSTTTKEKIEKARVLFNSKNDTFNIRSIEYTDYLPIIRFTNGDGRKYIVNDRLAGFFNSIILDDLRISIKDIEFQINRVVKELD